MFKKIFLFSIPFILGFALLGCNTASDDTENVNQNEENEEVENVEENNQNEPNTPDENGSEPEASPITLETGSTETIVREIEGMDSDVEVVNYQIQPYNISYQLDALFDTHEVTDNKITYLTELEDYFITLEVVEHTTVEDAVANLQAEFEQNEFEIQSDLENTPAEENDLNGKMQYFAYPLIKGFIVYELGEHVLAITYQYHEEGADGMGPLLVSLRQSIQVE